MSNYLEGPLDQGTVLQGYIQFPGSIPVTIVISQPFSPGTLSGNVLWLDANNSGSVIQSGGFVSQWIDLSPTAATFVQATGNLQPAYIASAIGGKPALSFSGSASGKGFLTDSGTNQFVGDGAHPFSLWMVTEPGTAASFVVFADFLGTGVTNNPEFGFATADASYKNVYFAANSGQPFARARSETAFADPNAPFIISITFDGSGNYSFYNSNVSQTVAAAGNASTSPTNTSIGGFYGAAGADPVLYLSELAIYNRVLSAAELAQLQTYGNAKYGL